MVALLSEAKSDGACSSHCRRGEGGDGFTPVVLVVVWIQTRSDGGGLCQKQIVLVHTVIDGHHSRRIGDGVGGITAMLVMVVVSQADSDGVPILMVMVHITSLW